MLKASPSSSPRPFPPFPKEDIFQGTGKEHFFLTTAPQSPWFTPLAGRALGEHWLPAEATFLRFAIFSPTQGLLMAPIRKYGPHPAPRTVSWLLTENGGFSSTPQTYLQLGLRFFLSGPAFHLPTVSHPPALGRSFIGSLVDILARHQAANPEIPTASLCSLAPERLQERSTNGTEGNDE